MIPTSSHNEALAGDTLYSAFLNHEWRKIVLPFVIAGMEQLAAAIEDESDRQDFEVLYGAMIDDFYNEEIMAGTPIGAIVAWYTDSIPTGWLRCDGTVFDSGDYPDLATVLGVAVLPDFTDRFLFGSGVNDDVGDTGGENQHILTLAEIPAHSHVVPAHSHTFGTSSGQGSRTDRVQRGDLTSLNTQTTDTEAATNTDSIGGGTAHNNMPEYRAVHWIIKALP
jgi:microcystin-dependent protein